MNLFNLFATITADTSDYKKALNDAEKDIEDLENATDESTNGMNNSWNDMTSNVDDKLTKASTAIVGFIGGLGALSMSTEDSRQQMILLETSFENAGHSAEVAEETYKDFYGILGDEGQAVEASSFIAKLTDNQQELSEWTNISAGVYSQFGNALPLEGLAEATLETSKVGVVTGQLADALNWAGISEDEFNEKLAGLSTEEERLALITSTLNGEYSNLGTTYLENADSIIESRDAQAELGFAMNDLGEQIAPLMTDLMYFASDVLPKAVEWFTKNQNIIIPLASAIVALTVALKGVLFVNEVVKAFTSLKKILDLSKLSTLAMTIATKAQTFATALATTATTAFGVAMSILTSPITLIVGAIAGLIAIVYLLIQNWETVSRVATEVWNWIVSVWQIAAEWYYTNVIQPVLNIFMTLWNTISTLAINTWNSIVSVFVGAYSWFQNNVVNPITSVFSNAWNAIASTAQSAWNKITSIFSGAGNFITGVTSGIASIFISVVNGLISGINKVIYTPLKTISNALSTIHNIDIPMIGKPFTIVPNGFTVPQIPMLATGDVAEPNNEYLAILGDNKKEQEVVSPLSTMKQAFREEIGSYKAPMTKTTDNNGILQVLIEIRDLLKNQAIYLDSKTLVGSIVGDIDKALGVLGKRKLRGV